MIEVKLDEIHSQIVWWHIIPPATWEDLQEAVAGIKTREEYNDAKTLILNIKQDMPKGSPLNHLRVWFSSINQHPTLEHVILIMDRTYPITKTFINLGVKVFSQKSIDIVDTVDEAMALILEVKDS